MLTKTQKLVCAAIANLDPKTGEGVKVKDIRKFVMDALGYEEFYKNIFKAILTFITGRFYTYSQTYNDIENLESLGYVTHVNYLEGANNPFTFRLTLKYWEHKNKGFDI